MTSLGSLAAAEARKVLSTRTFLALLAALVVVLLLLTALVVNVPVPDNVRISGASGDHKLQLLFAQVSTASLFALVAGILLATNEFRYGTIVPSLLANPSRHGLVTAKVLVAAIGGLLLGAVAAVVLVGVGWPWLSLDGPVTVPAHLWERLAREVGMTGLWAALGVGLGVLLRNQVVAIVGALAWTLVVENVVLNLRPGLSKWLLLGLDGAITGRTDRALAGWWVALGLFALYIAAAAAAGAVRLNRSDV